MRACFHCGMEVPGDGRIPREESCERCDQDLRCCRNCRFFDSSFNNQCSEPQADWISDKERANFCDSFVFSDGEPVGRTSPGETEKGRQSWKKLFKDG